MGGGGGGAGAAVGNVAHKTEIFKNGDKVFISDKMENIKLNLSTAEGTGGSSLLKIDLSEPDKEYIKDCPEGSVEIIAETGNRYCMTKYNVRPEKYEDYHYNYKDKTKVAETEAAKKEIKVSLPEGTFDTEHEYSYIKNNRLPACWITPSGYSSTTAIYPPTGRSVCNWYAANIMCPQVNLGGNNCSDDGINFNKPCKGKWHLIPEDNMLKGEKILYRGIYPFLGEGNLINLCTDDSKYHSYGPVKLACPHYKNSCEASFDSICYSSTVTGSETDESNAAFQPFINQTQYSTTRDKGYSTPVRCILKKAEGHVLYSTFGGGGGSSSNRVKNFVIPKNIIDTCKITKNCFAEFTIAAGKWNTKYYNMKLYPYQSIETVLSKYSESTRSQWRDGYDSTPSIIEIKANNKVLWGYKLEGGKGGKHAEINAPGKGGEAPKLCWENKGSDYKEVFECAKDTRGEHFSTSGETGLIGAYNGTSTPSSIRSVNYAGCSTGINAEFASSKGYCGSSSNSGSASLDYKIILNGSGGGGGGGAAFIHIKKIPITPNKEYEIIIGGGGRGSYYNSNNNLVATYLSADTKIYLDNNTIITTQSGKNGQIGTRATENTKEKHGLGGNGGKVELSSDSPVIQALFTSDNVIAKSDGGKGQDGFTEGKQVIGGNGGISGIFTSTGTLWNITACGGLFNDEQGNTNCTNGNNVNGAGASYLSNLKAPVRHIYKDGNYGSYGAGGGGGGWKYEDEKHYTGKGGDGQGGYVYFYW